MLDKQAQKLDQLLKTLPRTSEYEYRRHVITRAPTEVNPGDRSDVSSITTQSVDRAGDVVIARGMNDAQFQSNPLVPLQHAYHLPPVGKSIWRKRITEGDLVGIKAKTRYPERPADWPANDPWIPEKVFTLIQTGLLQGKSIGFLPTKAHFADAKEAKREAYPEGTLVFDEWLLLEYSCVFLPCNQDALVESVAKGLDLPDELLQAMGIDTNVVPRADLPALRPTSPFTTLTEVQRVVETVLAKIDWQQSATRAVETALAERRGRV